MKKEYNEIMDNIKLDEKQKANILLKAYEKAEKKRFNIKKLTLTLACVCVVTGGFLLYQRDEATPLVDNKSVMIPNPMSDYQSIEELKTATFDFTYPSSERYEIKEMTLIASKLVQLDMQDGAHSWTYRTTKGKEDISGDYNVYENEEVVVVNQWNVTLQGDGTYVKLAIWSDDECSYSLSFEEGIDKEDVLAMIASIC